jgi:predicted hydrolase (HD superfamily)
MTADLRAPRRDEAWALLCAHTPTDALRTHALAVEAVMRHFAPRYGGDPEVWGAVGLVHDLDYDLHPQEHCRHTPGLLRAAGWPEPLIRAVLSHGWGTCTDVEPESDMERVLFAIDELTGLIAATALVRPSRSVLDTTVASVRKKWKTARFAAGVDRALIERGAERLGMPLEVLIGETLAGMQAAAAALGLAGDPNATGAQA